MIAPQSKSPDIPQSQGMTKDYHENLAGSHPEGAAIELSPLIETVETELGYPYSAQYFGKRVDFNFDNLPDSEDLKAIDDFVKEEMELEGYKPVVDSYKKIIVSLKRRLGIDKSIMEDKVIERLAGFIRAYRRILNYESKDKRQDILGKLLKYGRNRDLDKEDLALFIEEQYRGGNYAG